MRRGEVWWAELAFKKESPVERLPSKVEDLEDILLVKESLGALEEEAISLEDYER